MFDFHLHFVSRELLSNAKSLGYSGLGIVNAPLPEQSPVPLFRGLEISPKNAQDARRFLSGSFDFSLMHSSSVELARSCGKLVDILALDFNNLVYDPVIAAGIGDAFVEFDLSSIIFSDRRMQAMSNLAKAVEIARKSDNRIIVSLRPKNEWQLRSLSDMRDLVEFLGFSRSESKEALIANPKALAELISVRKSKAYVSKDVKLA